MTPIEKAEDLISIFLSLSVSHYDDMYDGIRDGIRIPLAKKSAIIAVDEILKVLDEAEDLIYYRSKFNFWIKVKNELQKI